MIQPITIQSGKSSHSKFRTFMCYGDIRTGKTHFTGSFPNAMIIADASERGWTTLEEMDPAWFYHDKGPEVIPVHDQATMTWALAVAEECVKRGWIDTIVVDSLTFYAQSWFQAELKKMQRNPGPKGVDTRGLYGAMANHLTQVQQHIHGLPCNVAWTALAAPPDDEYPGGPMVSGKSRLSFPARCDYIFYHRKYEAQNAEHTEDNPDAPPIIKVYEAHTEGYDNRYIGGGRDGGKLPAVITSPTFRQVAEYLKLAEYEPKHVPQATKDKLYTDLVPLPTGPSAPSPTSAPSAPAPAKAAASKPGPRPAK